MPLYEYICKDCKRIHSVVLKIDEWKDTAGCPFCGSITKQVISSPLVIRSFKPQVVGATLTSVDGDDVNQYVRNKQELTDAVNRYNDTERASRTGKVAVLE